MLFLLWATAAAGAPSAELLERIAERLERTEAFVQSGSVNLEVVAEELDADGVVEHTQKSALRTVRGKTQVLSAARDGVDNTDDEKHKQEKREQESQGKKLESPFGRNEQAKYTFSLLSPDPKQPELIRVAFAPKGDKKPELIIGDASIDAKTADLVRLSGRPSKNPTFVDHIFFECAFDAITKEGRALSKLSFRGEGGVLFIKKRFRVVTEFKDYAAP